MIQLHGRKIDEYGNVILSDEGIMEIFYQGDSNFSGIQVENSEDVKLHNKWVKTFDNSESIFQTYVTPTVSVEEFDKILQDNWMIPEEYKSIDVNKYFIDLCTTPEEVTRVEYELTLYKDRKMLDMLRCLIYLVDIMRENKIVWGIGRGSSCASYSLYLLGIHKVNSIKYDIDIHEFLK